MVSPQDAKELFNLRHASLRNVVERIFGILKRKFRILLSVSPELPKHTQIQLIPALAAIHNFERLNRERSDPADDDFDADFALEDGFSELLHPQPEWEEVAELAGPSSLSASDLHIGVTTEETAEADRRRDRIAGLMWADYQRVLSNRARGAPDTDGMESDNEN